MNEETQNPEISPAAAPASAPAEGTSNATPEVSEDAVTLVGGHTAPAAEAAEEVITSVGAHLAASTESTAGAVPAVDAAASDAAASDAAASDAAASETAASETAPAEGDAKKKKKRRRKKKKKPSEGNNNDARPAQAFTRMFGGKSAGRQSPFKSGEIVAGIVRSTDAGTITLDLFGRAMAFVDAREAHAIEPLPEPPPKPEKKEPAPKAEAPAVEAVEAAPVVEAVVAEAAVAETAPVVAETAVAETAVAETAVAEAVPVVAAAETAAKTAEATSAGDVEAESSEDDPGDDESPDEVAAHAESNKGRPQVEPADLEPSWPEPEMPAIGSVFRGRIGSVAESGDMALVNRAVDRPATKAGIRLARDEQRRVEGVIFGYNRGGFDVLVSGVRCFCPARSISLTPIGNPRSLLGQKLEFSVPPSRGGKSIIVSRRGILERELRKASRDYMKALVVGTKLEGAVTQVRDYGLLVDIGGGVEGLVHQSEVSWNRGDRPADAAKPGDKVMVEILKVTTASRKDRYGKVSLSMKSCLPDPWNEAVESLQKGVPMKGKVVRNTEFGAFIELAPSVEGLLHISELGRDIKHAKDVLKEGEEIDIIIERMDKKARRLSLSRLSAADMKAIAAGELDLSKAPKSLKPGTHLKVKITRVEHHGMFAQVEGVVGKRGRGYINNRDLPEKVDKKNRLGQGSMVDVRIVGTDRDGSLKLSIKGFLQDEERNAVREYRKESAKEGGFGTFGDLLKAKLTSD